MNLPEFEPANRPRPQQQQQQQQRQPDAYEIEWQNSPELQKEFGSAGSFSAFMRQHQIVYGPRQRNL